MAIVLDERLKAAARGPARRGALRVLEALLRTHGNLRPGPWVPFKGRGGPGRNGGPAGDLLVRLFGCSEARVANTTTKSQSSERTSFCRSKTSS